MPTSPRLVISGGSHGEKERVGIEVVDVLRRANVDGVEAFYAHPALIGDEAERRSIGPEQILRCFPGKSDGNPEQVAAHEYMQRLGERAGNPSAAIADIHSNGTRGLEYTMVGMRTSKAALAAARYFGKHCVVSTSPGGAFSLRPCPMACL